MPGAVHYEWARMSGSLETLKPLDEIRKDLGVSRDHPGQGDRDLLQYGDRPFDRRGDGAQDAGVRESAEVHGVLGGLVERPEAPGSRSESRAGEWVNG